FRDVEHRLARNVVHEPHATGAEDAPVGDVEHIGAEFFDRIVALGVFAVPGPGPAFLEDVVLQLALAGLIADGTVEWMVDQQELENSLARLLRLLAVNVDDLAFG